MAYFRVVSCLAVVLLFAASGPASRAEFIVNGDFTTRLEGWTSPYSSPPDWLTGAYVKFAEEDPLVQTFDQLEQTFNLPTNALTLLF